VLVVADRHELDALLERFVAEGRVGLRDGLQLLDDFVRPRARRVHADAVDEEQSVFPGQRALPTPLGSGS
jgi:hypothetical protein